MKNVYSIILVSCLTFALFSCKKDKDNDGPNEPDMLTGLWELAQTSAGMMPGVQTYDAGNGNMISFKNGKYEQYDKGRLIKKGSYIIEEDGTVAANVCLANLEDKFTRRLVFDYKYGAAKIFIYVNDGKLSMISGCYAVDAGHLQVYRNLNDTGLLPEN